MNSDATFDLFVLPAVPGEIAADENVIILPCGVFLDVGNETNDPVPVGDGSLVEWEIVEGEGGALSVTETEIKGGGASVELIAAPVPGRTYRVQVRLKKAVLGEKVIEYGKSGPTARSAPLTVIPGQAANIQVTQDRPRYPADGTTRIEIAATIQDAHGNLVADGTCVSWSLAGMSEYVAEENRTTAGVARLVLKAGNRPDIEMLRIAADDVELKHPICLVNSR